MPSIILQTAAVNAHGSLTVLNFGNLPGHSVNVTVNSHVLSEGSDWTAATSNAATALSLQTAIDAVTGGAFTTAISNNVITITSTTTGAAGNDLIDLSCSASSADLAVVATGNGQTLGGGADAFAGGLVGNGRVRISTIAVAADSSGGSVQLFSGTDNTGTEYDLITGTASRTTLRTYKQGMVLGRAYLLGDSHITKIVAQFTAF